MTKYIPKAVWNSAPSSGLIFRAVRALRRFSRKPDGHHDGRYHCRLLTGNHDLHPEYPAFLNSTTTMATRESVFKEAADVFSPKDLVQLPRPGTGTANEAGDLLFVSIAQYNLKDNKLVLYSLLCLVGSSYRPQQE